MSPLPEGLGSSLDALNKSIEDANRFLKRLPSCRHESCSVHLDEYKNRDGEERFVYLEFAEVSDEDGELYELLVVTEYNDDGDKVKITDLTCLPISKRLKAAKHIPDLISLATAAEKKMEAELTEGGRCDSARNVRSVAGAWKVKEA